MDGSSDCTMSLSRWQKLIAARMRRSVPEASSETACVENCSASAKAAVGMSVAGCVAEKECSLIAKFYVVHLFCSVVLCL